MSWCKLDGAKLDGTRFCMGSWRLSYNTELVVYDTRWQLRERMSMRGVALTFIL